MAVPTVLPDSVKTPFMEAKQALDLFVDPALVQKEIRDAFAALKEALPSLLGIKSSLEVVANKLVDVADISKPVEYSLPAEGAQMGDQLEIRIVEVKAGKETLVSENATFRVRIQRMGSFYTRTPLLIFAQGKGDKDWRPTASLTTFYQHGTVKNPEGYSLPAIRGNIGFNLGAFDFDKNEQFNMGFGLAASALNNLIQFGYGYAPQEKKQYAFFGVRLSFN